VNKNSALLAIALLVGVNIPTSIEKIPNPTIKTLVQLLAVLVLVYLAMKVDTTKFPSIHPPPPSKR